MSNTPSADTSTVELHCPSCRSINQLRARFCQNCGWELSRIPNRSLLTGRNLGVLILGSGLIWAATSAAQLLSPLGNAPDKNVSVPNSTGKGDLPAGHPSTETVSDPQLDGLRSRAKIAQDDKEAQHALAEALIAKLQSMGQPPSSLVLETIDVLRNMLRLDENDSFALVTMADLSYNQQVFNKSADFYASYLKKNSDDLLARTRLGSSLFFIGKVKESEVELKKVLQKDPKFFEAAAHLTILYTQQRDEANAASMLKTALSSAPTDEAREQFRAFLEDFKAKKSGHGSTEAAPEQGHTHAPESQKSESSVQKTDGPGSAVASYIKSNSVAGPKFAHFELKSNDTIALYFHDFPMDKMPPFVKDKFLNGVKAKTIEAEPKTIKHVLFIDHDSGAELSRIDF